MMNNHEDFYTQEAATYENVRYGSRYGALFRIVHHLIVSEFICPVNDALDVGTGTGQMLKVLASNSKNVIACDLNQEMLNVAKIRFKGMINIQYTIANAFKLPFEDDSFDMVTSSRFLHLFPIGEQAVLIKEMFRVLKPNGKIIIDFYSTDGRKFFLLPIFLYRKLLRKRPENDYRLTIKEARNISAAAGLKVVDVVGVGNFMIAPFVFLPARFLLGLLKFFGKSIPGMSEQFVVFCIKP